MTNPGDWVAAEMTITQMKSDFSGYSGIPNQLWKIGIKYVSKRNMLGEEVIKADKIHCLLCIKPRRNTGGKTGENELLPTESYEKFLKSA